MIILKGLWICLIYARLKDFSLAYRCSTQYSYVHMLEYVYDRNHIFSPHAKMMLKLNSFGHSSQGQIHVLEYILECIHRSKIQPDPSTLWYTFCAYEEHELYNTAIESLLVLSMRMISEDAGIPSEKRIVFENLILSEEPDAEFRIIRAFQAGEEFLATALLNLRWCATMGATVSWSPEESLWAMRLAASYDANKRPHINPSDAPKSWGRNPLNRPYWEANGWLVDWLATLPLITLGTCLDGCRASLSPAPTHAALFFFFTG